MGCEEQRPRSALILESTGLIGFLLWESGEITWVFTGSRLGFGGLTNFTQMISANLPDLPRLPYLIFNHKIIVFRFCCVLFQCISLLYSSYSRQTSWLSLFHFGKGKLHRRRRLKFCFSSQTGSRTFMFFFINQSFYGGIARDLCWQIPVFLLFYPLLLLMHICVLFVSHRRENVVHRIHLRALFLSFVQGRRFANARRGGSLHVLLTFLRVGFFLFVFEINKLLQLKFYAGC